MPIHDVIDWDSCIVYIPENKPKTFVISEEVRMQ